MDAPGSEPDQVLAAVECIGRAGHWFDGQSQPVRRKGAVCQPYGSATRGSCGPTPCRLRFRRGPGPTIRAPPSPSNAMLREGVVDLRRTDGARCAEVEFVARDGAEGRGAAAGPGVTSRNDSRRDFEGPLIQRRRSGEQVGVRANPVGSGIASDVGRRRRSCAGRPRPAGSWR